MRGGAPSAPIVFSRGARDYTGPMRLIPAILLTAAVLTGCAGGDNTASSSLPPIPAPPDVAAVPADAQRTGDNLASKVLKPGTGARHPRANSEVTVHYT